MARQDDVEKYLMQIAPLFREVSLYAQAAAAEIAATEPARKHLARTAALNQVSGTVRWRVAGDEIVRRSDELPAGFEVTTDDSEQNQGRYYLSAAEQAVVFTIRRKPHTETEKPEVLQLQMRSVLEQAPVTYEDAVAVYLAIPPEGEPHFEVVTGKKSKVPYLLCDLIERAQTDGTLLADAPEAPSVVSLRDPETTPPTGGPSVSSSKKRDQRAQQQTRD
jgi:hypothetical protein